MCCRDERPRETSAPSIPPCISISALLSVHHCIHHRLNKLPGSWLSPRAPHCWHRVEYITTYWLSAEYWGQKKQKNDWRIGGLTLLPTSQLSKWRILLRSPLGSCGANFSFSTAAGTSKPGLPPVRGFWKWTPISWHLEDSYREWEIGCGACWAHLSHSLLVNTQRCGDGRGEGHTSTLCMSACTTAHKYIIYFRANTDEDCIKIAHRGVPV